MPGVHRSDVTRTALSRPRNPEIGFRGLLFAYRRTRGDHPAEMTRHMEVTR